MQYLILRDGSHWQPVSPDNGSNELLRLYSDKVIASYVLSGVPELAPVSINLYEPVIVPADCMPAGVAAFWLSRDEKGRIEAKE